MDYLNSLEVPLQLDIWTFAAPGGKAAILVPEKNVERFQDQLSSYGIPFRIDVENIRPLLEEEDRLMNEAKVRGSKRNGGSKIGFDRIYNLTEVYGYLEDIANNYPDLVTLVNAGHSFEGRDVKYLKISTTNFEDKKKPVVVVQSLLHAREWVTLPPSLYAIEKLVVNVTDKDLIDKIDWIIFPIANPDGYEFTHTEVRFWRKNRATGYTPGDVCVGVDLNRNFDIFWGYHSTDNVCAETFHGSGPFSEPEARIVAGILHKYTSRIELFIDLHSTGSMIIYGWGTGDLPPNALRMHAAAIQMTAAIDAVKAPWNPNYTVGNVALIMYKASGITMDYGKKLGIPYSYIYELPRHRNSVGLDRFLVDPAFVYQAAIETWEGIKEGARYVRDRLNEY
ncbi:carboxypeptidase B-like [Bicyclus anynana]|uniref:Carboxypeptidase B-like n=1 Tax=Bicyclus anynana TaxID=110368 RepID=A0A6J1MXR8_BICAN|nr:carboxypeptidase B-like [Bicyclus anynana]